MLELCNLDFQIKLSPALCTAQYKNTTVLRKGHAYLTSTYIYTQKIYNFIELCMYYTVMEGGTRERKINDHENKRPI